jgi:hypothetical protein
MFLFFSGPVYDGTVDSLETLLEALSAPSVRTLCTELNVKAESRKEKNVEALVTHCKTFKKNHFGHKSSVADVVSKK